ncbi:hypothetical protein KIF59_06490 [Enterobacter cloacae subsp. cloacae]|nr:hypothetical protein [Enterobacter cloacae subsp. cloacae]
MAVFYATRGIWGWLHIDPASSDHRQRSRRGSGKRVSAAGDGVEMSDAQTAEHLKIFTPRCGATCSWGRRERRWMPTRSFISTGRTPVRLMSGHPKFIFTSGRRGWGWMRCASTRRNTVGCRFRLHWVAVQREHLVWSSDVDCDINSPLASTMDSAERARFDARWQALKLRRQLVAAAAPVAVAAKNCRPFPPSSRAVRWQSWGNLAMSIWPNSRPRTLTNASRRAPYDIKLPLTIIYNTSCYRGIPAYIAAGPLASRWLQQQFRQRDAYFHSLWRAGAWRTRRLISGA